MFYLLCRASPSDVKDTEFTVKGLLEGREYEFRVAAVNDAGTGAYAETSEAIKPAAPTCKSGLKGIPKLIQNSNTSTIWSHILCKYIHKKLQGAITMVKCFAQQLVTENQSQTPWPKVSLCRNIEWLRRKTVSDVRIYIYITIWKVPLKNLA